MALFSVCLTMREDTDAGLHLAQSFSAPAAALVHPVDTAFFAGALRPGQLPPLLRLMMRAAHTPEGDFRDWPAIRAWAANLSRAMGAQGSFAAYPTVSRGSQSIGEAIPAFLP